MYLLISAVTIRLHFKETWLPNLVIFFLFDFFQAILLNYLYFPISFPINILFNLCITLKLCHEYLIISMFHAHIFQQNKYFASDVIFVQKFNFNFEHSSYHLFFRIDCSKLIKYK